MVCRARQRGGLAVEPWRSQRCLQTRHTTAHASGVGARPYAADHTLLGCLLTSILLILTLAGGIAHGRSYSGQPCSARLGPFRTALQKRRWKLAGCYPVTHGALGLPKSSPRGLARKACSAPLRHLALVHTLAVGHAPASLATPRRSRKRVFPFWGCLTRSLSLHINFVIRVSAPR